MRLVSKHFNELSGAEVYEILKACMAVFYMEQHIFYLEAGTPHRAMELVL